MERVAARGRIAPGARLMSETLVAKWAELASQALLLLLVPRTLGPSAYGEFAIAFGTVSLLALGLGLGASLAAIRYVPGAQPAERLTLARALARRVAVTRAVTLGILTPTAIVAALVATHIPVGVVIAVCAAAWFSVASSITGELALALDRPRVWNARFPLENCLVVAAAIAGHAVLGTHGAIVGIAVASALTFLLLSRQVVADLRGAPAGGIVPEGAISYARLATFSALISIFVMRGSPLAVPVLGGSSTQAGFAAIATGIGAAGAGVVLGLLLVQMPRLADVARTALTEAEAGARHTALAALAIGTVAAVPAAAASGPIIDFALGSEFSGSRDAVVLALPAVPLAAAAGLASLIASLRLRPGLLTAAWSFGGLAFVVIAAIAVPEIDSEGAALAMTGGFLAAGLTAVALIGGRTMRVTFLAGLAGAATVLLAGLAGGAL